MSSTGSMSHAERRVRVSQTIRVVIWLVVLAALVALAAVNTERVNVDWIADESDTPLWLVIGASALAGSVIGYVVKPSRH
jgi:uncharacterized integral membrane protein